MRTVHLLLPYLLLPALQPTAGAQSAEPRGVWNTGTPSLPVQTADMRGAIANAVERRGTRVLVDLYPGFAAIRTQSSFANTAVGLRIATMALPVRGHHGLGALGRAIHHSAIPPALRVNGAPVAIDTAVHAEPSGFPEYDGIQPNGSMQWRQEFLPDTPTEIETFQVVRTHLARRVSGDSARDGNALSIPAISGGQVQVLVRLREGVGLTEVRGLLPREGWQGDMRHLQLGYDARMPGTDRDVLIWYEGAPPDFPFEAKVPPALDTLRRRMDAFPVGEFNAPGFQPIRRSDFNVDPTGLTLAGLLYFLMFLAPWVILGAIVISLLRGRKPAGPPATHTNQTDAI